HSSRCDFATLASIYWAAPALRSRGAVRAGVGSRADSVQTTLLGLAIAFVIALVATLVGPYVFDWNQFRPQLDAAATRSLCTPARAISVRWRSTASISPGGSRCMTPAATAR